MHRTIGRGYWLLLVLLVAVCVLYAERHDLWGRYQNYQQRSSEVGNLREELDAARAAEEQMRRRVEGLDKGTIELERTMRGMNWVREGETIYRVDLPEDDATP